MNIVSSDLCGCKENLTGSAGRKAATPEVPADSGLFISDTDIYSSISGASAPLVVYTKSCSQTHNQIYKDKSKSALSKRYGLHDIACRLLTDKQFNSENDQTLIDSGKLPRTCLCQKTPLLGGHTPVSVPVYKSSESSNAHFGGLLSCGKVWSCPICAEKIAQARSLELKTGFDSWFNLDPENHTQLMVTLTIPHYANDSLSVLYNSFMKARRLLKQQKVLKRDSKFVCKKIKVFSEIRRDYLIEGLVASLEITWGVNGWHPHSHDVFFVSCNQFDKDRIDNLKKELTEAWLHACLLAKVNIPNISHFIERSVHIRIAHSPAEYLAKWGELDFEKHQDKLKKWGVTQELTRSHIKRSRGDKGLTPWDMLRLIQEFPDDRSIYLKFGLLWREFITVMESEKSRRLWWEPNFKSALFSDELQSDEEIVESESGTKTLIGIISQREWKVVLKHRLRGQVLYLASRVPWSDVRQFINNHDLNLLKAVSNE